MKRLLISVGVIVGLFALVFVVTISAFISEQRPSVVQTVEAPSADAQFVLATNLAGFGDQRWAVYRQRLGASPKAATRDDANSSGALFWNYTESGDHSENARLDLIQDRYLVFSRGGFRYSLYDVAADTILVNEISPWHTMHDSMRVQPTTTVEEARVLFDEWVRDNLDRRIDAILRGAA